MLYAVSLSCDDTCNGVLNQCGYTVGIRGSGGVCNVHCLAAGRSDNLTNGRYTDRERIVHGNGCLCSTVVKSCFHLLVSGLTLGNDSLNSLLCSQLYSQIDVVLAMLGALRCECDLGSVVVSGLANFNFLLGCGLSANGSVICLNNEGNTVEEVGHTAKEQRSLTDDHSLVYLAAHAVVHKRSKVGNT